jgi:hypothetical protein
MLETIVRCRLTSPTMSMRLPILFAYLVLVAGQAQGDPMPAPIHCAPPRPVSVVGAARDTSLDISIVGDSKAATFRAGSPFSIRFAADPATADTLAWQIRNYSGETLLSGEAPVARGSSGTELACTSTASGYFAVFATLKRSGASVPQSGSRPAGFVTFGVLPDLSRLIGASGAIPLDGRRFGLQGTNFIASGKCCDGNGLQPINELLGSTWVLDARQQGKTEPKHPGEYNPDSYPLEDGLKQGGLARLVTLNGIPGWASAAPDDNAKGSYPPKSFSDFQNYMARVGRETEQVRQRYIPSQQKNYYQVTWEPDPGPPTQWAGNDADFVSLYRAAWQGLHSSDPHAVVMGPATMSLTACGEWLRRLAPLGFTKYLDALACHGYYTIGTSSDKPPESADLPGQMQNVRGALAALMPPGTRLFITETGIAYPAGSSYSATYPTTDVLVQHAEAVVRAHLILLGEGADVSFLFYSADYTSEVGFGLYFNLSMPHPDFGSPNVSPKPAAMAVAAMTRLIGATRTLGALRNLPAGAYGYAFELPDGRAITALWAHDASFKARVPFEFHLDAPRSSGTAEVADVMGNHAPRSYADGRLPLTLEEMPLYVIAARSAALMGQVRAPASPRTGS